MIDAATKNVGVGMVTDLVDIIIWKALLVACVASVVLGLSAHNSCTRLTCQPVTRPTGRAGVIQLL